MRGSSALGCSFGQRGQGGCQHGCSTAACRRAGPGRHLLPQVRRRLACACISRIERDRRCPTHPCASYTHATASSLGSRACEAACCTSSPPSRSCSVRYGCVRSASMRGAGMVLVVGGLVGCCACLRRRPATMAIRPWLAGRRGGRLLAVLLHDGLLANIVFR